jgi:diguanylate cyclase (GGDEF)-like protein
MAPSATNRLGRIVALLAAIAAVAAGVALDQTVEVELLYVAPALYAGYRLRGFALTATVAAIGASCAGALALAGASVADAAPRVGLTVAAAALTAGMLARTRSETERLAIALRESVTSDPLTGALNRRGLEEAAQRELPSAARSGLPVAVVLCEVENYETLAETFGPDTADAALIATVDRIRAPRRPRDRIGRVGRACFAVLLPETPRSAAVNVAERMRAEAQPAGVKLRVGLAAAPEDGAGLEELLDIAVATLGAPTLTVAPMAPEWTPEGIAAQSAAS